MRREVTWFLQIHSEREATTGVSSDEEFSIHKKLLRRPTNALWCYECNFIT